MIVHRHRVRYHEADAQGFLFNSRFLEVTDVAMAELFRHLGWTYDRLVADGADPSVVSVTAEFHAPARFDDVLDVDVAVVRVGRSSFELRFTLTLDARLVSDVRTVYVNVDTTSTTSRPLPAPVADALRRLVPAPGAGLEVAGGG